MVRRLLSAGLLACILCLGAPTAAAAPDPQVPTAADFGALPVLTDPVLSPDGKRVAARGLIQGQTGMLIIDFSASPRKITPFGLPKGHQLEWFRWAGSDKVIVSLSRTDSLMGEDVRITRLISIDLVTGKSVFIGPEDEGVDGDDVIHVDHDGKFLLLSTQATIYEYPSVYKVDLVTGKDQQIVKPIDYVWSWYADPAGVVRAGIGINSRKWWIVYRDTAAEEFKRTTRHDFDDDDKNDIEQFLPVDGSDKGYAVANGDNGRFALYRYDFKNDQLGDLIYENPEVDIDSPITSSGGKVLGVYYTDDRAETAWFDPDISALQSRIDAALPDMINRILSVSDDKKKVLFWSGSASDPGSFVLLDPVAGELKLLARTHEALKGKTLSPMQSVRYKARDGLDIRGYLTLPAGHPDKNLPLVVMPHGGPFARDEWGYDPWVQYLASKGYAVLQPNYRGSTGFGREFVEKGSGQWGRGMQDDVDDGVKWLAEKGTVDPKRVCIMGGSYGGYAAEWAAIRNPETYRCAISFAGVSDIEAQLKYSRKSFSAPRYFRDWRERVQGEASFQLDQISPLKQVARMTVPILIAHGTDDDTVPTSQSKKLHEALVKLGRPHEYVLYKDEGHGFDNPVNSIDFLNRVGAFLDKYNPS